MFSQHVCDLELRTPRSKKPPNFFKTLSKIFGHEHNFITCEDYDPVNRDMVVDVEKLVRTIDNMLVILKI